MSTSADSNPHLDVGRLCFGTTGRVVDADTGAAKGAVSSFGDCAVASATQVVFADSNGLPSNHDRVRWLSEPQMPATRRPAGRSCGASSARPHGFQAGDAGLRIAAGISARTVSTKRSSRDG